MKKQNQTTKTVEFESLQEIKDLGEKLNYEIVRGRLYRKLRKTVENFCNSCEYKMCKSSSRSIYSLCPLKNSTIFEDAEQELRWGYKIKGSSFLPAEERIILKHIAAKEYKIPKDTTSLVYEASPPIYLDNAFDHASRQIDTLFELYHTPKHHYEGRGIYEVSSRYEKERDNFLSSFGELSHEDKLKLVSSLKKDKQGVYLVFCDIARHQYPRYCAAVIKNFYGVLVGFG